MTYLRFFFVLKNYKVKMTYFDVQRNKNRVLFYILKINFAGSHLGESSFLKTDFILNEYLSISTQKYLADCLMFSCSEF